MGAKRAAIAGLGTLGLLISGAAASFGAGSEGENSSSSSGDSATMVNELVPAFSVEQAPEDELRDEIAEISGVVPQTSRLLGEAQNVRFWAATSRSGAICLIAQLPNGEHALPGDDPVTGTACTPASVFATQGAAISVGGYTAAHGVVAYLLPAKAPESSVRAAA